MAKRRSVRYAVIGLGWFSQIAVLPAFARARSNSRLVALFSDSEEKRRELGLEYGVKACYPYERFEERAAAGEFDAAYIVTPNHLHAAHTTRAAAAGIHVLCEKPMAVTESECEQMIDAAEKHDVRLMIGYRLHFEKANMKATEIVHSRRLGEVRMFNS